MHGLHPSPVILYYYLTEFFSVFRTDVGLVSSLINDFLGSPRIGKEHEQDHRYSGCSHFFEALLYLIEAALFMEQG